MSEPDGPPPQANTFIRHPASGTPAPSDDLYEVAVLAEHEDGTQGWAIVCSLPVRQPAELMAKAHLMRVDVQVEAVQIRHRGVIVADYRPEHFFGNAP
ncbi:hypothetical protein [Nonomuraea sp. NPDC005650]|uniref:hypothetical protein n=1 Tax=Nonomuraea sp. NPDC005650 TaxID=3157045 RepID=UPI0033A6CCA7